MYVEVECCVYAVCYFLDLFEEVVVLTRELFEGIQVLLYWD